MKVKYDIQTNDIFNRIHITVEKGDIEKAEDLLLIDVLKHEHIYVLQDSLSKDPTTVITPDINAIARVINSALNKYVDSLFNQNEHDYATVPLSRLKWIKTHTASFAALDSNIKVNIISLRIDDLLKQELVRDSIIHPTDKISSSMQLSDLFVSGFSLSPELNKILDLLNKEFKINTKSISLIEAASITSIKECTDLIKEKAGLSSSSNMGPFTKWMLKNIPNYFTTAKSSDEIIKPRSSRSPVSYSYSNLPESRQIDAYYGFNVIGFLNNNKYLSIFLGPVGETHLYKVSDRDSVNTESWGMAVSLTELVPRLFNLRLKEFGLYYFTRNDYKKGNRAKEVKGSVTFSFEPRNDWRYFLPSYEPIGFRSNLFSNAPIEVVSYTWSPSVNYDFIGQGTSDTEKLGPLSVTMNASIFFLQRVIEFDASWKFKVYVNSNTTLALKDFNMYREFGIKLNVIDIKSVTLKPIVKDFKLSIGFDYQDGINLTTGTNQVIRSLTFGFGF